MKFTFSMPMAIADDAVRWLNAPWVRASDKLSPFRVYLDVESRQKNMQTEVSSQAIYSAGQMTRNVSIFMDNIIPQPPSWTVQAFLPSQYQVMALDSPKNGMLASAGRTTSLGGVVLRSVTAELERIHSNGSLIKFHDVDGRTYNNCVITGLSFSTNVRADNSRKMAVRMTIAQKVVIDDLGFLVSGASRNAGMEISGAVLSAVGTLAGVVGSLVKLHM